MRGLPEAAPAPNGFERELSGHEERIHALEIGARLSRNEILTELRNNRVEAKAEHADLKAHVTAEIATLGNRLSTIELERAREAGIADADRARAADNERSHTKWTAWLVAIGTVALVVATLLAVYHG